MTVRALLEARAEDDSPGLLADDTRLTWREYVAAARGRAAALAAVMDPERPAHVGVLLENSPEMAIQLAAAGWGSHVLVGLNTTRRGSALLADARKADVQVIVTEPSTAELLDGLDLDGITVIDAATYSWPLDAPPPAVTPEPSSLFMLIFTSGTSGNPKAVRITHEKISFPAAYLTERLGLTPQDVHYISMPMFHSNAVIAGWAPALFNGAAMALARRFSASGFLADVRRYGATYANYVGKPLSYILATEARADDAENPLRMVFGNEGNEGDIAAFAERFDCRVIDGFGSTENAVVISRTEDTPAGSLGRPAPGVAIFNSETHRECPAAVYDEAGRVTNLDDCVGELVNTQGMGQFAGYYNDPSATAERMRAGMYWSGDLAYRDEDGWIFFAGRTADWLRVDGENLAAAPIERILLRHPAISEAAVYAVPDPASGDQLVVALVLNESMSPAEWTDFLAAQPDLATKAWPRYVQVRDALPRTATNKVLKRTLQGAPLDPTWTRDERGRTYRGS